MRSPVPQCSNPLPRRQLAFRFAPAAMMFGLLIGGCEKQSMRDPHVPHRVVTLTPSSTEVVAILGATARLVGVDVYSTYPPSVLSLPKVGDFLQPNVEAIVSLKPDLVVLDSVQAKVAAALNSAGIRTILLSMHTMADVNRGIAEIGQALGRFAQAKEIIATSNRDLAKIRKRARHRGRKRVLALVEREQGRLGQMIAAGPGSYLDELLAVLNAENAVAGSSSRYVTISVEEILRSRPEVILDAVVPVHAGRVAEDWRSLPSIPAVRSGRIYPIAADLFMAPSPRLATAARTLETMIYGTQKEHVRQTSQR